MDCTQCARACTHSQPETMYPDPGGDRAMRDLQVVVIGGGIGGLTTAAALLRSGQRVVVLEQTEILRPVGAGISLWSNGVKVLDALGLGDEVAAVGGHMERLCYRDVEGTTLCDFSLE